MNSITGIIALPALTGMVLFLVPDRFRFWKGIAALLASAVCCYFGILIYTSINGLSGLGTEYGKFINDFSAYVTFRTDNLSKLIVLCITFMSLLIISYSIIYVGRKSSKGYFSWFLITLSCSCGAALADNLIFFLGFWGILGITLYKLIPKVDEDSSAAAKKTLILIGASDSIMIIGIALIWKLAGTLNMSSVSMQGDNAFTTVAFLALLAGSFTKAGAFPFHSWVPDYAKAAPASSSAYMPASLDKLLGIYFLARITNDIFIMNEWMKLLLLTTGVASIIAGVMMALVQHNYRKLLGFHAVSQAGYMIVGFGLGSAIGVAAGLFHMINNALYKSGLFLTAGSIGYRTGKDNIEDTGGLSKAMPLTFFASLVFAMSISGIPPFNGFASKWMIYQGIIDLGSEGSVAGSLWVIWLGLAVLGSALTMASFIKFIGGVFLGRRRSDIENIKEVPAAMCLPQVFLAIVCILGGVFATGFVVPEIIMPASGEFEFNGLWNSSIVSLLVLVSISLGIIVYSFLNIKKFRTEDSFIGGEKIQEQADYPVTDFYNTIKEFRFFSWAYTKADEKWFDVYDLSKRSVLWLSHQFSEAHTGVLTGYILWAVAGLIIMLMILI